MDAMFEQRLDRIEAKLDKVTDELAVIVRVEEKQHASTARIDRLELRMDGLETEQGKIKERMTSSENFVKASERVVWLVVSAAISAAVYLVK